MARSAVVDARLAAVRARAGARRAPIPLADAATLTGVGLDPLCEVVGAIAVLDARSEFWTSGWIAGDGSRPTTYTTSPPNKRVGVPAGLTTRITAFNQAFARLLDEARALDAHGVLGIRVETHRTSTASGQPGTYEAIVHGVAVRARRGPMPATPFTTSMSGPQVAAALRGGLVPVTYLQSPVMAVRYIDPASAAQMRLYAPNGEVEGFTDLLTVCRDAARRDFTAAARRARADVAVLDVVASELHGTSLATGMHTATAVVTGTALARFTPPAPRPRGLAVVPLADLGAHR